MLQANRRFSGRIGAVGNGLQPGERPRARSRAFGAQHQRFDVAIEQLLLLVRERLELFEHAVELDVVELEAELLHAIAERMPAAVLAEHQRRARKPTSSGRMISYVEACFSMPC